MLGPLNVQNVGRLVNWPFWLTETHKHQWIAQPNMEISQLFCKRLETDRVG